MVEHIDSEAGIGMFRQGRSLCIRLRGTLDDRTAHRVARLIHADRTAVRLRLECSALDALEDSGVRHVASSLLAWTAGAGGRTVDVLNLAEAAYRPVSWHPLRSFSDPDEVLFFDPDREPSWELSPSRH